LTVAVSAIVAGVVAGVGAYYAGTLAAPVKEVTKTLERTLRETVTKTETLTTTTTTTLAPGAPVTTTVTTTVTPPPVTTTVTATTTVERTVTTTKTVRPPTVADIPSRLIEVAKKEGKVVFYNTLPVATNEALEKRFESLYGIDLEWYRAGISEVVTRFTTEFDTGKYLMDVMRMPLPSAEGSVFLRKKELFAQYLPPEADLLSPEYKDPEGYWFSDAYIPWSMAYNTKLLKPEEVPKKVTDLTDPKWKGKITWADIRTYPYAVNCLYMYEKHYGIDLIKGIAANKPLLSGTTYMVPVTKVATGEAAVSFPVPITLIQMSKDAGNPIDWVRDPDNNYVAELASWMLSSKAPHPNAAKLFLSFILAVDGGQHIMHNVSGYQPVMPGVISERPELLLKDIKFTFLIRGIWGDLLEQKKAEYEKIFG